MPAEEIISQLKEESLELLLKKLMGLMEKLTNDSASNPLSERIKKTPKYPEGDFDKHRDKIVEKILDSIPEDIDITLDNLIYSDKPIDVSSVEKPLLNKIKDSLNRSRLDFNLSSVLGAPEQTTKAMGKKWESFQKTLMNTIMRTIRINSNDQFTELSLGDIFDSGVHRTRAGRFLMNLKWLRLQRKIMKNIEVPEKLDIDKNPSLSEVFDVSQNETHMINNAKWNLLQWDILKSIKKGLPEEFAIGDKLELNDIFATDMSTSVFTSFMWDRLQRKLIKRVSKQVDKEGDFSRLVDRVLPVQSDTTTEKGIAEIQPSADSKNVTREIPNEIDQAVQVEKQEKVEKENQDIQERQLEELVESNKLTKLFNKMDSENNKKILKRLKAIEASSGSFPPGGGAFMSMLLPLLPAILLLLGAVAVGAFLRKKILDTAKEFDKVRESKEAETAKRAEFFAQTREKRKSAEKKLGTKAKDTQDLLKKLDSGELKIEDMSLEERKAAEKALSQRRKELREAVREKAEFAESQVRRKRLPGGIIPIESAESFQQRQEEARKKEYQRLRRLGGAKSLEATERLEKQLEASIKEEESKTKTNVKLKTEEVKKQVAGNTNTELMKELTENTKQQNELIKEQIQATKDSKTTMTTVVKREKNTKPIINKLDY